MPPTNLITGSDLTAYAPDLDLTQFGGASSATVSGIISQVTQEIVDYCQVKGFDYALETNEEGRVAISSMGELYINFRRRPVQIADIQTVKLVKGGFATTLVLTDTNGNSLFQVPYPGVSMTFPSSYLAAAGTLILGGSTQLVTMKGADVFYQVTYTGGFQSGIPNDIKRAAILWFRDVLAVQQNPTGAYSFTQGSYSQNFGAQTDSRLVKQAKQILNQSFYRRMATF